MNIPPNQLEYASSRYTALVVAWTLNVEERAVIGELLNQYAAAIDTLSGIEAKVQARLEASTDLRPKS